MNPFGKLPQPARDSLGSFLRTRPEVALPPELEELAGTHGFYLGDDRPEREIVIGFRPAFVVYTTPVFPDGPRRRVNGEFFVPPLHDQPAYTERGFKVGIKLNRMGQMHSYVAWKPRP
jgi:hypothetical protein